VVGLRGQGGDQGGVGSGQSRGGRGEVAGDAVGQVRGRQREATEVKWRAGRWELAGARGQVLVGSREAAGVRCQSRGGRGEVAWDAVAQGRGGVREATEVERRAGRFELAGSSWQALVGSREAAGVRCQSRGGRGEAAWDAVAQGRGRQ
jgi:hypothetical protein